MNTRGTPSPGDDDRPEEPRLSSADSSAAKSLAKHWGSKLRTRQSTERLIGHTLLESAGRLSFDLHCVACGHNLRGLERDGRCGECGSPVPWSLQGSYLGTADPDWVERLRAGAAGLSMAVWWIWLPLSWPVLFLSYWRLTAPDPADRGRSKPTRAMSRGLYLVAFAAALVLQMQTPLVLALGPELTWLLTCVGLLLITQAAGFWALRRIASRAESLRSRRRITRGAGIMLAALLLQGGAATLGALNISDIAAAFAALLGLALFLMSLIGFLLALGSTWRELEAAAVQARGWRDELRIGKEPPIPATVGAQPPAAGR